MKIVICDRCGKPTQLSKQMIIPFDASPNKKTCLSYKGEQIEIKDLCNECFEKYKKCLKKFFDENKI